MARPLRIQFPGAVYHIFSRGIEGRDIFRSDKEKQKFLKLVSKAKQFYRIEVYLYCLLSNHYHISIETPLGNVSQVIHWINSTYTSWYNRVNERKGHLFQGRYTSILVEKDEYLLALSRYIHLNPVKAGIVKLPKEYEWSSYRTYMGLKSNAFLNTDFILSQFGSNLDNARVSYKKFVEAGIGVEDNLMDKLVKGFILGSEKFVEAVAKNIEGSKDDTEIPQLKALKKTMTIDEFFNRLRSAGIIIDNNKKWGNIERDVIIYLCKRFTLCKNSDIGDRFGLTDAAISYICNKIERCKDREDIRDKIGKIAKIFDF